jgi:AraC-like DNA-binding protein
MQKLTFQRNKYGPELLIDATRATELDIVDDLLVLNFYCIMFLADARGDYFLDAERFPLHPRQIVFVKPGQINRVDRAIFQQGYFLFFEGDFLDEFFHDAQFIFKFGFFHNPTLPGFLTLPAAEFAPFYRVAEEIWQEMQAYSADSRHLLRSLVYYLLIKLNRSYARVHGSLPHTLTEPRLLQFFQLLERHIREQHTVQSYAEALGISRVYLNQLCHRHFGKTSRQLVRERLLLAVKKELLFSEKSVAEIAYDLNFSAPAHLTRFFRQMTGTTPQAYRQELSKW